MGVGHLEFRIVVRNSDGVYVDYTPPDRTPPTDAELEAFGRGGDAWAECRWVGEWCRLPPPPTAD